MEILVNREIADRGRFSWIPRWLNRPILFGAQARVEVWGNVQYGINVHDFNLEHISVAEDGAIEIELPPLQITAVEPDLTRMTITYSDGVFRPDAGRALRDSALADIDGAFREQAAYHIDWSTTSAENVARSLAAILTPAFEANGMDNPRFRFRLSENVFLDMAPQEHNDRVSLPNP